MEGVGRAGENKEWVGQEQLIEKQLQKKTRVTNGPFRNNENFIVGTEISKQCCVVGIFLYSHLCV